MSDGLFIVVEGIDGSGSTTLARELVAFFQKKRRPAHSTCEPSGGPVGAMIRQILSGRVIVPGELGPSSPGWATMALLFAADRLDHLEAEILPRLREGVLVLSDRYDLSSLAYQTATAPPDGRTDQVLAWIRELNREARRPDLTIVLDVKPEVAASRRRLRGGSREIYDDLELQEQLARAYADAEKLAPGDRIAHVDANQPIDAVLAASIALIERL